MESDPRSPTKIDVSILEAVRTNGSQKHTQQADPTGRAQKTHKRSNRLGIVVSDGPFGPSKRLGAGAVDFPGQPNPRSDQCEPCTFR